MLELVKALQITIAITALAIVVVYLPLTIRVVWEKPRSQTTHWIMAKLLMWVSQAIAFEYLWYSYAFGGVPVFVNPRAPERVARRLPRRRAYGRDVLPSPPARACSGRASSSGPPAWRSSSPGS
jgi:hypothetical protein